MALVISTLVLRYSLEALKASGPQKCMPWHFVHWPCISPSHTGCRSISTGIPFTAGKNRTTWRNKLYGFLDEQDYQELAGLPVNAAMQSYHRVERLTSIIVLILVTLLLTAAASEFWSISMLFQSGYTWVMSGLQFLTPSWVQCGPNGVLVYPSGLK